MHLSKDSPGVVIWFFVSCTEELKHMLSIFLIFGITWLASSHVCLETGNTPRIASFEYLKGWSCHSRRRCAFSSLIARCDKSHVVYIWELISRQDVQDMFQISNPCESQKHGCEWFWSTSKPESNSSPPSWRSTSRRFKHMCIRIEFPTCYYMWLSMLNVYFLHRFSVLDIQCTLFLDLGYMIFDIIFSDSRDSIWYVRFLGSGYSILAYTLFEDLEYSMCNVYLFSIQGTQYWMYSFVICLGYSIFDVFVFYLLRVIDIQCTHFFAFRALDVQCIHFSQAKGTRYQMHTFLVD